MARAKYYIKKADCKESDTVFETTRKADAERYFNRLCKDFKRNVKFAVETVRMGCFTVRYIPCSECTEYWIEKY